METDELAVQRLTSARIPTVDGEFELILYGNTRDDEDHLALVYGQPSTDEDVLVRIHSECFTGDVLGSLRCDCGEQLNTSMRLVAENGSGVILYLRQEGRGIGLLDKLRAYNLQDEGYDTVEANRMLGHGADERDYSIGAHILSNLDIDTIRLLTNNPEKIEALEEYGISVAERVPLQPHMNQHNTRYLRTKVERMRHLLDIGPLRGRRTNAHGSDLQELRQRAENHYEHTETPFVTLSYAQSLDGSIAARRGEPLSISGPDSLELTHQLRATHDAILVGINTVLSDDPQLTVRRVEGSHPRPIVLDTELRFPSTARLLGTDGPDPLIATNQQAPEGRIDALRQTGVDVLQLPCDPERGVCLQTLLSNLADRDIRSVMVEGGARVISSFIEQRLADHFVITIAPMLVGGLSAVNFDHGDGALNHNADGDAELPSFPRLKNIQYRWLGEDMVLQGDPDWSGGT